MSSAHATVWCFEKAIENLADESEPSLHPAGTTRSWPLLFYNPVLATAIDEGVDGNIFNTMRVIFSIPIRTGFGGILRNAGPRLMKCGLSWSFRTRTVGAVHYTHTYIKPEYRQVFNKHGESRHTISRYANIGLCVAY